MQFWWVFLLLKFNFRWFFYKITFAVAWICKIRPNFKLDFFLIFCIFFGPSFGNWSTRKRKPQTCYKKTYSRSLIMWMIRLNQQKSDTMKNKIYENVLMLSHCAGLSCAGHQGHPPFSLHRVMVNWSQQFILLLTIILCKYPSRMRWGNGACKLAGWGATMCVNQVTRWQEARLNQVARWRQGGNHVIGSNFAK